jgi:hypothetical protein
LAFALDFSAEGNGYRSSTDADGQSQHFRSGNGGNVRAGFPPSSYPYLFPRSGNGNGNGNGNDNGKAAVTAATYDVEQPEDVHAYSTVGDASISLYPSSADHHADPPLPPLVGGSTAPPEKHREEEYQLPERGYSGYGSGAFRSSGMMPSPPLDADPFGANRRPTAFNRVFGERPSGNMAGVGTGRGSAGASPTSPTTAQGRGNPVVTRAGASPVLNRGPSVGPPQVRRLGGIGSPSQDMGFGRQHQTAVGALSGPGYRDSNGFSEGSSPTAVGFPGDIGSVREDGSPVPTSPFAGRSGYGAAR